MQEPKNAVGPQVIKNRNRRGWSQEKFAAKCQLAGWDVSRDIVARIEGGVRCVTDIELIKLARALHVPVPELLPKKYPK